MKNNFNNKNMKPREERDYSFYSRVLKEPFDSIAELKEAEEAYYAKLKAKEDKALQKKNDAKKVEDAFKALNAARKIYKEDLLALTTKHSENLKLLKDAFENDKVAAHKKLADAETAYQDTLKAFTDKYPEGYHLTLRDGDFETTISSSHTESRTEKQPEKFSSISELFDYLFM